MKIKYFIFKKFKRFCGDDLTIYQLTHNPHHIGKLANVSVSRTSSSYWDEMLRNKTKSTAPSNVQMTPFPICRPPISLNSANVKNLAFEQSCWLAFATFICLINISSLLGEKKNQTK